MEYEWPQSCTKCQITSWRHMHIATMLLPSHKSLGCNSWNLLLNRTVRNDVQTMMMAICALPAKGLITDWHWTPPHGRYLATETFNAAYNTPPVKQPSHQWAAHPMELVYYRDVNGNGMVNGTSAHAQKSNLIYAHKSIILNTRSTHTRVLLSTQEYYLRLFINCLPLS